MTRARDRRTGTLHLARPIRLRYTRRERIKD
jgi:hypothetical protein